jgi:O-acetyl-ADP-ribose deacetylase (regulator of RNase III)
MGTVYRARQRSLDRRVAIKICQPGASSSRFLREAQLLAKVRSPYVVTIHDFEMLPDGHPMLVMEWIEGQSLAQIISSADRKPLDQEKTLAWMAQTCHGMQAVSDEGIIHRDLKPSNILIDIDGRAKVADFGFARGSIGAELTGKEDTLGTPLYMAPEQAENPRGVDTRSDIYSFGATFYHALTGAPPFEGDSVFSIQFKHKTEPLVVPKFLSDRTSELLERCLAKSPQNRFQSFAEILHQLGQAPGTPSPWEACDDGELAPYLEQYAARRAVYLQGKHVFGQEDVYHFPGNRVLQIQWGSITKQQVDAIVSSDDTTLSMAGGVSWAIRTAAWLRGRFLEFQTMKLRRVRPGRAVVTSAAGLPARYVFHGVILGSWRDRPSRDLISQVLASCFYHADTLYVRTIAFPLLGTGNVGFSKSVCLDTTFRFLSRMLLRGSTSVQDARIALYWRPGEVAQA